MNRACVAGMPVGDGLEVVVAGALNVSPESFYAGSVATRKDDLLRAALAMAAAGARMIDIGAMSTAPYLPTAISEPEEADRLAAAVALLAQAIDLPLSADTSRCLPAEAALHAGARIINDVSGLSGDPGLAGLVARTGAGLIVMASERASRYTGAPIEAVSTILSDSLQTARAAGIDRSRIVVDPGIGFFRNQGVAWYEWDCAVLARLQDLHRLGHPVCVGVSRKSFIGAIAGTESPAERLPGSLAATAVAVSNGAHLVRTHDVAETVQAVRVAAAIREAREGR